MSSPVSTRRDGDIAVITVDNPPVNALSHAVRAGLAAALDDVAADDEVRAAVLVAAGRTFIAGADITEFGKPPQAPMLPELLAQLDDCPKLTVAALHGTALGGGLETALCCHYRIAVPGAKVGLPESLLGLLPGAGGTQRLPRLVGAEKALDMMISGKPIGAGEAREIGVIDRLTDDGAALTDAAVAYARELLDAGAALRRAREQSVAAVAATFFDDYRRRIQRRTRGFEAPERIVKTVEAAVNLPFDQGMERERELFMECMASPQSAAMRHLFFAERAAAKVPGIDKTTPRRTVARVGVIGAGTMGAGIALACIDRGLPVLLTDAEPEGLKRGVATIGKLLDAQVAKGRIDQATRDQRLARLTAVDSLDALADCDLIIEAVFESMAVKEDVFGRLDKLAKPGAILATNTSTLDVDRIAAATSRPDDVIGLHFFSPANVMRLLEIVRGGKTSPEVIASSLAFARAIGKVAVVVGNCFGFVGNRMLYGYGRENQFLLLEGAAPEAIDKALTGWGMAMGPNAVGDLAGLDVGHKIRQERDDLPDDPRYYRIADRLVEMGRLGQKTGAGTFRYEEGSRTPLPDPAVQAMIEAEAEALGIERRDIDADEIVQRCLYALVVVGAELLDEGIAIRASDIDIVWTNGYGFPAWRGGPMHYADHVGLGNIVAAVRRFSETHGEQYWPVPPLLQRLADEGKTFADFDAGNAGN